MKSENLTPRITHLFVSGTASDIGLELDRRTQQHRLGLRDAPRYRLTQPFSPDDAWEIAVDVSGGLIGEADASWLSRLPAGEYLLVRSPRTAVAMERVLLGNELVVAPPNIRVLEDQPPVYACVVGAQPDAPPRTNAPLLGLAILNYVGESWMHGVWFFELATGPADDATEHDELLLIVPVEGELVLDNMGFFSAEDEQRSLASWKEQLAEKFADWCAGADASLVGQ